MRTTWLSGIAARCALACCACAVGLLLAACGSDHLASAPASSGGSSGEASTDAVPPVPGITSGVDNVTLTLPAGVTLTPDKLKVVTSAASAVPDMAGAVSVTAFAPGSQLAIVMSPAGNPMLYGWIDSTHTIINAETTAEVLAYFALQGSLVLQSADADAIIAAMPQAPGIGALATSISSEIAASVDAFATPNVNVAAALKTFVTAIIASAGAGATPAAASQSTKLAGAGLRMPAALAAHIHAITSTPGEQSGISVIQDPPYAAHLTNAYRRRSYVYVDRVSHTIASQVTDDPLSVTSFEIEPTKGVNGGLTGAITDIYAAYWGVQPTAYAENVTDSFNLPLLDGTDATTYRIVVVGPGFNSGTATLTAAQSTKLTEVSARSFMLDYTLPVFTNAILGSGFINFKNGYTAASAKFVADFTASATTDFLTYLQNNTGTTLNDELKKGKYFDAFVDITGTEAGSNELRTIMEHAFNLAIAEGASAETIEDYTAAQSYVQAFSNILNLAGFGLQAIDTAAFLYDLHYSDNADEWTVTSTASKVQLNPSPANISGLGSQVLTASVSGVESLAGYSFHWTTTTTIGDLSDMASGGQAHQTDYCSASPKALFVVKPGAAQFAHDTVVVEAYNGANCGGSTSPNYAGTGTTLVTYVPSETITVSPPVNNGEAGGIVNLSTVLSTPLTDATLTQTYNWVLTGTAGGSLTDPSTGLQSQGFNTSSSSVVYTGPATLSAGTVDTVTVSLSVTLPSESRTYALGKGSATIDFGAPLSVGINPQDPQVAQGALQQFTVKATSGTFPTGTTFKWVLSAGFDLYGDPRDLGLSGGGDIGTAPVPDYSGMSKGTSETVTTTVPTIMFAENGFGAGTNGPDFSWVDELQLQVTVLDSSGNVLQTATTMIQTQVARDIILP
jgi:hypothetical protein